MSYTHPNNAGGAVASNSTPFNAIPSNARAQNILSQALGEANGFIAGMRYLDETESLKGNEPGDGLLEPVCFSKATIPPLPLESQSADQIAFSSIRGVRDGIKSRWKHFDKVSQSLDEQIITRLRETYHDPKTLREAGVFAFRDILTGDARNNLETFFAFCSLSHVVSGLLHTRGKFDKTEILGGLPVWLDALEVEEDQEAFQKLARTLWPEANTQFYELNTPVAMPPGSPRASASIPNIGLSSPSALSLATKSSTLSSFQAPHFPNVDAADQAISLFNMATQEESQEHVYNPTDNTHAAQQYQSPQPASLDSFSGSISQTCYDMVLDQLDAQSLSALPFVLPSAPKQRSGALGAVLACVDNPAGLHATKIFDAVAQYCSYNGNFWYDLSGRGIISKDSWSRRTWNEYRAGEQKRILKQYLAPLLLEKDKKDMTSRGIVSVVEGFVDMGYLQSTEETKGYMAQIASSLFRDGKAQGKFITWVNSPPKLFPCLTCQKGFPRKGNMERHSKKCGKEAPGGKRQRQDARRAHPYR